MKGIVFLMNLNGRAAWIFYVASLCGLVLWGVWA